jgi:hypothetical protein
MLNSWSGQEDISVAVPLHGCDVSPGEQGNAFIVLWTEVCHISSTDNYIHTFFFEPLEGCFQPNPAAVGITDNADSHPRNLSPTFPTQ